MCIAGRYIQGAPLLGNSAAASDEILVVDTPSEGDDAVIVSSSDNSTSTPSAVSWRARFVGQGYKQVYGRADVWGDSVVPEMAAHLDYLSINFLRIKVGGLEYLSLTAYIVSFTRVDISLQISHYTGCCSWI